MRKYLVLFLVMSFAIMGNIGVLASDDSTLVIGIESDVRDLDPGFSNVSVDERVRSLIFDGLVEYGENNRIVPGIAEKWDVLADGKEYIFYLRKGVKFHEGTELTAKDVKYTYERILNPDNASLYREKVTKIDKIEVIDEYTIKFMLKEPFAPFMLSMTFGIVPKDYVEKVGMDEFSRKPIGAGPFKLAEWIPDTKIVLERFADYWMTEPKLERVVIRPIPESSVQAMELRSGGIDVATNLGVGQLETFKDEEDFVIKSAPGGGIHFIGFNEKMPPYNNPEFKEAVLMATPFDMAVPQIYGPLGVRAYSFVPPTLWPDDREYLKERAVKFNPDKAREMVKNLKEDGVINDDFTVEVYVANSNPSMIKVIETMVTALRQVGLKAEAQVMEFGTMWDKLTAGEVGIYTLSFVSDPDPDFWIYRWFTLDGSLNKSFYENEEVDKWLREARRSTDQEERSELYKKVLRKTLIEDKVLAPFAHKNKIYVMNEKVKELYPSNPVIIPIVTPVVNVYKE